MEEQILEMLTTGPDNGNESMANKITFHVMKFIEWKDISYEFVHSVKPEMYLRTDTGCPVTLKEIYQYWLNHVK